MILKEIEDEEKIIWLRHIILDLEERIKAGPKWRDRSDCSPTVRAEMIRDWRENLQGLKAAAEIHRSALLEELRDD